MASDITDIRIAVDMPDRRSLVARLCAELGHALAGNERWEREDIVVPWHASAPTFDELPARVVATLLDEWDEADARLAGIEFSGYLETDHGPRAWGSLVLHEGRPRGFHPEVDTLTIERIETGYRLELRLLQHQAVSDRDDG
jgi:hypothetical protein